MMLHLSNLVSNGPPDLLMTADERIVGQFLLLGFTSSLSPPTPSTITSFVIAWNMLDRGYHLPASIPYGFECI